VTLAPARKRLAAKIADRGIKTIVYFHTDHFEPWRTYDGRAVFGPENQRDLEDFATTLSGIEFARRLTLFYKPHLNFARRTGADMMHAAPGDEIGFMRRTPKEEEAASRFLQPLLTGTGCQFQLHVHHENYTANATITSAGTDIGDYLATAHGCALDDARFEFAVRTNLDIIARETGRRLDRWFFVHGHWALNASDDADCRIVNEIEILHRLGCRGDFTFPAGRAHVDSRHDRPYLCKPVAKPKGYDTAEAEPEPAAGAGSARGDERFLIWASAIKHGATSIDHYSPFVRKRADDIPKAAERIIDQSYCHDGTLYVKTHAHCMQPVYYKGDALAGVPHTYPATRDLLSLVFDAGADGGAAIAFETVSEVYDRLLESPARDTTDMAGVFNETPLSQLEKLGAVRPSPARHPVATASPGAAARFSGWTKALFKPRPPS
jgi:hypothetical protein